MAASAAQDIVPFSARLTETQYQDTVRTHLLTPHRFDFVYIISPAFRVRAQLVRLPFVVLTKMPSPPRYRPPIMPSHVGTRSRRASDSPSEVMR